MMKGQAVDGEENLGDRVEGIQGVVEGLDPRSNN
jgi:hypothetical protein